MRNELIERIHGQQYAAARACEVSRNPMILAQLDYQGVGRQLKARDIAIGALRDLEYCEAVAVSVQEEDRYNGPKKIIGGLGSVSFGGQQYTITDYTIEYREEDGEQE